VSNLLQGAREIRFFALFKPQKYTVCFYVKFHPVSNKKEKSLFPQKFPNIYQPIASISSKVTNRAQMSRCVRTKTSMSNFEKTTCPFFTNEVVSI
jgi:hypothetical protein